MASITTSLYRHGSSDVEQLGNHCRRIWGDLNPGLSESSFQSAESNLCLIAPAIGVPDVAGML